MGPRPPRARQALHRRRRRQGLAAAGADRRGVRRRGADDLRAAAWATPAARSTSSTRSPATTPRPTASASRATVREAGCAIIGQTGDLAPADRRLYAIRDATGTVESIPLIVASILSKKLAAGLDALVMDVKVGSGAFLPELDQARELAQTIIEVAAGNGLPAAALLTDMDRVLGRTAGNAVEVRESIDHLTGAARDPRLLEVTLGLCEQLLRLEGPRRRPARPRWSPAPRPRPSRAWCAALGGPTDLLERPDDHLPGGAGDRRGARRAPRRRRRHRRARRRPRGHRPRRRAAPRGRRRSTTPSASPRSRRPASASARRASRWRSSTPATRTRPPAPPRRWRPPSASATACWTRTRRCWRSLRDAPRSPRPSCTSTSRARPRPTSCAGSPRATGCEVPEGVFAAPDRFAWRDFLDFLNTYNMAASVIRTGAGLPRRRLRVPRRLRRRRRRSTSS